ncbi:MAG TPA: hypothetical protein VMF51_18200 [Nocardioides sp.]|uniref:hypothetical protein n=1 Tax=Nocardioides sp. TaxID=35761 RepID=UPI002BC944FD|nr:hypothetical protein [Nocardioides sp.]HTW17068.1 hypothetical protein [Nocardioides sp.]
MTPPKKRAAAKPAAKKSTAKKAPAKKATAAKKTTKRAPAKKAAAPRVTARDRNVLELRRAGVPFDVIADRLNFRDVSTAHASYLRALAGSLPPARDEAKALEVDRLEKLQTVLWPKALKGDLKAMAQLVDVAQERMRIISTDPLPVTDQLGPIETATAEEVDRLRTAAPALAAAALVLARVVDEHRGDPNATATAARELRMTMSQLRGLAGTTRTPMPSGGGDAPDGEGSGKGGSVTWLDELRQRSGRRTS